VRPIRSFLYAPGNLERLVEKAPQAGADAVMFDLADSVPVAEKEKARTLVAAALQKLAGAELFVKLNDADSGRIAEDMDAIAITGLCGVLLPRVSNPETVQAFDAALTRLEEQRSLPPGRIEIILLLETAASIIRAYDLAAASPRVASVCCATAEGGDLIRSLGSAWSLDGPERTYLRGRVLLAARAAGVSWPIDGVYTNLEGEHGLEVEARLARRVGIRGKLAIHPKQIPTINRIFSPSEAEIGWSRRVIDAASDTGEAFTVDGVTLGAAAVARADAILAQAAAYSR
jgi:citrate lyase subunit beta/citryl-CoA lyase